MDSKDGYGYGGWTGLRQNWNGAHGLELGYGYQGLEFIHISIQFSLQCLLFLEHLDQCDIAEPLPFVTDV